MSPLKILMREKYILAYGTLLILLVTFKRNIKLSQKSNFNLYSPELSTFSVFYRIHCRFVTCTIVDKLITDIEIMQTQQT